MREQAGHSLKSSLTHTALFSHKYKSDTNLAVKVVNEAAGLGAGNVRFFRNSIQSSLTQPFWNGWTVGFSLWGGFLQPLTHINKSQQSVDAVLSASQGQNLNQRANLGEQKATQSLITDRFFLGGFSDVRGFTYRGVGPRAHNDAIGGDLYAAAGLHLYAPFPLPKWRSDSLSTHFFLNGGSLVETKPSDTVADLTTRLQSNLALSCGAGFVLHLGSAKLEVNLCYPLSIGKHAKPVFGPQIGVAMNFL